MGGRGGGEGRGGDKVTADLIEKGLDLMTSSKWPALLSTTQTDFDVYLSYIYTKGLLSMIKSSSVSNFI